MRRQLPRTRDQERKPRGCCPADCRALENLPTSPLPRGRLRAYWARMTRIMAPRRALLTTSATFTEGRTHVDSSINYRRGRLHRLCPRASLAPRGPSGRQRGHCYSRRKAGESRANANLTTLPIHLRAIAMSPLGANHPAPRHTKDRLGTQGRTATGHQPECRAYPRTRPSPSSSRIQSAEAASRVLIFDAPDRRSSNRIGVSPIRQPTRLHQ